MRFSSFLLTFRLFCAGSCAGSAPDLFILAETEIWPNALRLAKKAGARTLLVNGRISDRSFPRYRKTRFFWTSVLDNLDRLSMIRVLDGERVIVMGANPVHVFVNGNCKFDQAALSVVPAHRGRNAPASRRQGDRIGFLWPGQRMKGRKKRSFRLSWRSAKNIRV